MSESAGTLGDVSVEEANEWRRKAEVAICKKLIAMAEATEGIGGVVASNAVLWAEAYQKLAYYQDEDQ